MNQRKKPFYSIEFKKDAAQLIISKGYSYPDACKSLGVSASALRKWVIAEKGGIDNTNSGKAQINLSEHEELLRLRKEVIKLKMEREILKKASAFFAQEMK